MVTIRFVRDSRSRLSSIFADGHADHAVAGDDLVCAAASTIVQTAELGLIGYAKVLDEIDRHQVPGQLRFVVPAGERDRADVQAILATAELGIAQLAQQYPHNVRYVSETDAAEIG
jgi:uncharacterized protein YsxB (DUF464 family)